MGALGKWVGRIDDKGADPEGLGRWSFMVFNGKNGRKVLVVVAYQACNNNICRAGTRQAWTQQWRLLRARDDKDPDPRKAFITDLTKFLKPYHTGQYEIILMGDFNETLGTSTGGMTELALTFGLSDSVSYHHGIQDVATHSRGSQRLDYMLCSTGIVQYVTRSGILPFHFVFPSDHRAIFMDLSIDHFWGGETLIT